MGQLPYLAAVVLAAVLWQLQVPVEYTFLLATFEAVDTQAFKRELPPELRRKLSGPIWTTNGGAAIALLLHGRLEDWLRNPQYVLEDVVGSAVQMRYGTFQDTCCDVPQIVKRLSKYWDAWESQPWAAEVLVSAQAKGGLRQSHTKNVARAVPFKWQVACARLLQTWRVGFAQSRKDRQVQSRSNAYQTTQASAGIEQNVTAARSQALECQPC
ncbi:unnamed protein product [Effrenium voratum]|nr:unnamed protein product [Effrenium voratum]